MKKKLKTGVLTLVLLVISFTVIAQIPRVGFDERLNSNNPNDDIYDMCDSFVTQYGNGNFMNSVAPKRNNEGFLMGEFRYNNALDKEQYTYFRDNLNRIVRVTGKKPDNSFLYESYVLYNLNNTVDSIFTISNFSGDVQKNYFKYLYHSTSLKEIKYYSFEDDEWVQFSSISYFYDNDGKVTRLLHENPTDTIEDYLFDYSNDGRVKESNVNFFYEPPQKRTYSYYNDGKYMAVLTQQKINNTYQNYTLDSISVNERIGKHYSWRNNKWELSINYTCATAITGGFFESAQKSGFIIYPNPFNNYMILSFENNHRATVNVSVLDLAGQKLKNWTFNMSANQEYLDISDIGLTPGLYLIKVENEYGTTVKKVFKY